MILHNDDRTAMLKNRLTSTGWFKKFWSMCSIKLSISSSMISSRAALPKPKFLKICKDDLRNWTHVGPLENKTPGTDPKLNPLLTTSIEINLGFWMRLRGWISKNSNIGTPLKIWKKMFLCLGKGKPLGDMGFTKKKWFRINPSAVGGWC